MFLGGAVMLIRMTKNGPGDLLAAAVRDARLAHGWGKEEAARRAGVSSATWKRVEDGLPVQDHKLNLVAAALGWDTGRAFRLKAGEDIHDAPRVTDTQTAHTDERLDAALAALELAHRELEALKNQRKA
jgi:transcriptional regulator with XRE-family HTH domain